MLYSKHTGVYVYAARKKEGQMKAKQAHNADDENNRWKNVSLRTAGGLAMATAAYHGVVGDGMIREIAMAPKDMEFVAGTYQLGSMGWVAGGVLLIGAASLKEAAGRNLIVAVTAILFGFPALGTLVLTGGKISGGGLALALVVALALYGRRHVSEQRTYHAESLAQKA